MKLLATISVLVVVAVVTAIGLNMGLNMGSGQEGKPAHSAPDPGPAIQAENFERALAKGDCGAVKKIAVGPAEVDCGSILESAESMKGIDVDAIGYRVTDSGKDYATVRLDINGEKSSLDLVKVDGAWFVVFDTAA